MTAPPPGAMTTDHRAPHSRSLIHHRLHERLVAAQFFPLTLHALALHLQILQCLHGFRAGVGGVTDAVVAVGFAEIENRIGIGGGALIEPRADGVEPAEAVGQFVFG